MRESPKPERDRSDWFAPSALTRARPVEQHGVIDRVTRINSLLIFLVLVACTVSGEIWASVPIVVLLAVVVLAPVAVKRAGHPERVDLAAGMAIFAALALAAGMTGGPLTPIVFLLPIGIVINGSGSVPRATALSASEISYRKAAILDPLTGLLNRQGLEARFEELREQALVSDAPICLDLFDLDQPRLAPIRPRTAADAPCGGCLLPPGPQQISGRTSPSRWVLGGALPADIAAVLGSRARGWPSTARPSSSFALSFVSSHTKAADSRTDKEDRR